MNRTQIRCRKLMNAMPMGATIAIDIYVSAGLAETKWVIGASRTCRQTEYQFKAIYRVACHCNDRAINNVLISECREVGKHGVLHRELLRCPENAASSSRELVQMAREVMPQSGDWTSKQGGAGYFGPGIGAQALRGGEQRI